MRDVLAKNSQEVTLSREEYLKLVEAYQRMGKVLYSPKNKKSAITPHTLYGIWEGVKVEEKDFQNAKRSLFPSSL